MMYGTLSKTEHGDFVEFITERGMARLPVMEAPADMQDGASCEFTTKTLAIVTHPRTVGREKRSGI